MTQPTRRIDYDRQTHDYAMFLDEQFIGFAATYHAAETTLDQVVADRLEWQARADRAAKLALVGLMQTLGLEGAKHDIRVNCLAPGPIGELGAGEGDHLARRDGAGGGLHHRRCGQ